MYNLVVLHSQFWTSPLFHVQFCYFLTSIQVSQETGRVLLYSYLFKNFSQFVVIHRVDGFSIINEADFFFLIPLLSLWSNKCWQFVLWFILHLEVLNSVLGYFIDAKTPTKWKMWTTWWKWVCSPQAYWSLMTDNISSVTLPCDLTINQLQNCAQVDHIPQYVPPSPCL